MRSPAELYGLALAITHLGDDGDPFTAGAKQLADNLARDLTRLAEAYSAEGTIDFLAAKERKASPALSLAFVRCDAARQAINRHKWPGDLPDELVEELDAALIALANMPCEPGDVPSKIRYLLQNHKCALGDMWTDHGAPELMAALDFHFGQGWTDRASAEAWREDIGGKEGAAMSDDATAELLNDPDIAAAVDKIGA